MRIGIVNALALGTLLLGSMAFSGSLSAQEQQISTEPASPIVISSGESVSLSFIYTVDPLNADNEELTGIGFSVLWDSSLLEFNGSSEVFDEDLTAAAAQSDTGDVDGNPDTDRLFNAAWTSIAGAWPGEGNTPTTLYTLEFTPTDALNEGSSTELTLSPISLATGFEFAGSPVEIRINGAPTADAGQDKTEPEFDGDQRNSVSLNGSNSSDDSAIVGYTWTQTDGADVALSDPSAQQPTFPAPLVPPGGETLTFELTVEDDFGLTDRDTVDITISNINQPPTAQAGFDPDDVDEGDEVTLTGANSGDDATPTNELGFAWVQSAGTDVELSGDDTTEVTFVAPEVEPGDATILEFELTVTDAEGLENTDTVSINVSNVNQTPVAQAGADQTSVSEVTLDGGERTPVEVGLDCSNSADPDGSIDSYQWSQTGGTPDITLSDPTVAQPSFEAPEVGPDGTALEFTCTVEDDLGATASDTVTINISNVNQAPTAVAGANQTVNEGQSVLLDATGSSDADGDSLNYTWNINGGPDVTLSDMDAAQPTFTAPDVTADGAAITFGVIVDDGALETSDTVIINVSNVRVPPTADAGGDQVVDEGTAVTLDGSASSDPEGSLSQYLWTQDAGPNVTLEDPMAEITEFTSPQVGSDNATLEFTLTVTNDAELQADDSVAVTVKNVNQAPTASATADPNPVDSGAEVTLDATASSDADADTLAYNWTQIDGPSVTLSDPGVATPTFPAPSVSETTELTFEVTVSDGAAEDTAGVNLNVNPVADDPVADDDEDDDGATGPWVLLALLGLAALMRRRRALGA